MYFLKISLGGYLQHRENPANQNTSPQLKDQFSIATSIQIKIFFHDTLIGYSEEIMNMAQNESELEDGSSILNCIISQHLYSGVEGKLLQQYEIYLDRNELLTNGEADYRVIVNKKMKKNGRIIDTHSNNQGCPVFMPAQDGYFNMSGKPDAMLSIFPAIIEYKQLEPGSSGTDKSPLNDNDYEVIHQSLDRLLTTSKVNGVLSRMVVFAITGLRCYVLLFHRGFNVEGNLIEKIMIFKVSDNVVKYIWKHLSYIGSTTQNSSNLYYLYDSFPLFKTIRELGYQPEYCRIRLIGSSTSRVYGVRFPIIEDLNTLKVSTKYYNLTIKVSSDNVRMENEIKCLDQIAKNIPKLKEDVAEGSAYKNFDFYYLGKLQNDVVTLTNGNGNNFPVRAIIDTQNFEDGSVWWKPNLPSNNYQTILMKYGQSDKPDQTNWRQVIRDVDICLYFIHGAGIIHSDVRKYNIVKFGGHWQVIDFDLACTMGTLQELNTSGSQYESTGSHIKALKSQRNHEWQILDDYQMLHELIYSIFPIENTLSTGLNKKVNTFLFIYLSIIFCFLVPAIQINSEEDGDVNVINQDFNNLKMSGSSSSSTPASTKPSSSSVNPILKCNISLF